MAHPSLEPFGLTVRDRLLLAARAEKNGCLQWTGQITRNGYGYISVVGSKRYAHRVAYEVFVGPIPEGLTLDHLCRNRACVNPAHLEPVTHRENTLRGESPPADNAQKDACWRGHEFTSENTYVTKQGYRNCRQCHRESEARRRKRKIAHV